MKTHSFGDFTYVGDPCNTARIFNELEVDELFIVDIGTAREGFGIDWSLALDLAEECFMPLAYAGGVRSIDDAARLFEIGYEKVSVNSAALDNPGIVNQLANLFGSQAVVVSIDAEIDSKGHYSVRHPSTRSATHREPKGWAREVQDRGAGEILLTSVEREGTWSGMDHALVATVANQIEIPLVAHGGVNSLNEVSAVINSGWAASIGVGNLVIFQKPGFGVLVHYPTPGEMKELLNG